MGVPGCILGNDFCGTIVSQRSNLKVKSLKVGDKVGPVTHGGKFPDRGSFAQYLKTSSDMVFVIPEDMKGEDAATFGVGYITAAMASGIMTSGFSS